MLTNIIIILRWIARYWYPSLPYDTSSKLIDLWISLIRRWVRHNGGIATIKRIKAIRLTTTRYICKHPLRVNSDRVSVDIDGFPKCIIPFKELVDSGNPDALRFTLTCLGISRSFPVIGKMDISSITKESTARITRIDNDFVKTFVKDFTGHFNPLSERPNPNNSFLSMKAGPHIGPSILTAASAAHFFTGMNLRGLAGIGGDKFMAWVKALKLSVKIDKEKAISSLLNEQAIKDKIPLGNRKFLRINDPEGKVRIVGCYDYISQLALNPYSEWAFSKLKEISTDRTFTQDPIIIDKKTQECYHSLDLSAATDRFPIDLQVQFLSEVAGPGFANNWKNLMVTEPFFLQRWVGDKKRKLISELIHYKVGQPMGARSSWATFTLCHHMVVQYAAFQSDLYPTKDYIILGDDVVIYNNTIAENYKILIADLGVEISESKSHVSIDTYEFAKRWFHKGIEISPVPIAGFLNNWDNPKLLYSQLLELIYKNRGPKSIIDSCVLMRELICKLRNPEDKNPIDFLSTDKIFKQRKAYSITNIKYAFRSFEELRLTLRNSRDFDFERTRSFMAHATKDNEYILPPTSVGLIQEWKRAGAGVVNGMAMSVAKDLSTFYKRYKDSYVTATRQPFLEGNPDVKYHPLTYAVYGSVKHFSNMNKSMGYTFDLYDQLKTITLINLDQLARQNRKQEELIFTFSTFARKLSRQLRDDHDLVIAKAQTMRFGRSLLDIQFAMEKEFTNLKSGNFLG